MARVRTRGAAVSRRASPERALHMSAAAFIRRAWPEHLPWTHFPAGELRDKATAGKLKGMGLMPGWPDFIFIMPNGQFAALELKARAGVLSEAQITVRAQLLACGCGYAVARSMEEVEATLSRWAGAYGLALRATLVTRRAA